MKRVCLALGLIMSFPSRAAPATPGQLRIIMTVDWEGDDLLAANMDAFSRIRQQFPDVPLLHYLNAAYFTKPEANAVQIKKAMDRVILPQDQVGLHLHGWKRLFEAAGVKHRVKPNWERGGKPLEAKDCAIDCGIQIPINAYSFEELRKVLAYSRGRLEKHGYKDLKHFRAGGWVTSPVLLEALRAEHFLTDSSAVPIPFLASELLGTGLLSWLRSYWKDVKSDSQPWPVKTSYGPLWEVPNNAALADYMESSDTLAVVNEALKKLRPGEVQYIIAGFHQETAEDWESRVNGFLKAVQRLMLEQKAPIKFSLMPDSF